MDSIEYELMNEVPREVYHCGICKRFRHRTVRAGILPAICCGQPARLFDRYSQPEMVNICEPSERTAESADYVLDSVMAQMQAAALLFPEPIQKPGKDAYKS